MKCNNNQFYKYSINKSNTVLQSICVGARKLSFHTDNPLKVTIKKNKTKNTYTNI